MAEAHPGDETVVDYASGALPEGMALLMAAHLTFCPRCRAAVAAAERVGGALLRLEDPQGVEPPALGPVLARIDAEGPAPESAPEPAPAAAGDSPLPAPLRAALGVEFGAIPWRFRLPGVAEHVIAGGGDGARVSLLRARPGAAVPAHTHLGDEATLILCGAMEDGGAVYRRGDVALAGPGDHHRPRIVGAQTCICLIVLDGGLRFTGRFGRALSLFAG